VRAFQSSDLCVVAFSHASQGPGWSPDNRGDLARLNQEIGGFDCLINLAAPPADADAETLAQNTTIALAALNHARQLEIPSVFLMSSAAVYGAPKNSAPLVETATPAPVSGYGQSKLAMEQAVNVWRRANPDAPTNVICLRVGNVAGADRLLLNTAKSSVTKPLRLDRFADGSNPQRSYIGPITLANVLATLCNSTKSGTQLPKLLNIAAPEAVFMANLLGAANSPWAVQAAPKGAIKSVCIDTSTLGAFHKFTARDSDPAEIIRQWRACGNTQ